MKIRLLLLLFVILLSKGAAQVLPENPMKLHQGTISDVSDSWQTVTLPYSYDSMVVVCTLNQPSYDSSPAVPRVRNASGNTFELKLQNPGDLDSITGYPVHYLVVEEGQYTEAEDGVQMEAVRFESTVTDCKGNWNGEFGTYLNSYLAPVVLGQVMTVNDSRWSVFWASGDTKKVPPSSATLNIGKHVGHDFDKDRANETIGYVVIEAGSGLIGDTNYEAQLGANTIRGVGGGEPNYYYDAPVLPSDVVILSSATMNGGDGGWPVLYGPDPLSNEQLSLAIDEDQIVDLERGHTAEQVAYLILSESESNPNTAPSVVSPIEDLTVDEDSADSVIELYPVFEDAETADTDLVFTASSSDESLVTLAIDNSSDELTLSFVSDANGSATISVTATDDDAENPLSVVEEFEVTVLKIASTPMKLHQGIISDVSDSWQTVTLPYNYDSMVVVCTLNQPSYDSSPAVPRVRNASGNTFELKLQNPSDLDSITGYPVHYLVVEEGQYTEAEDGVQMEAVRFESTVTDCKGNWNGEFGTYLNSYLAPVVLGQVMTVNDSRWSVFWASGDTKKVPPSSATLNIGKHVGHDFDKDRANETIGYVVIEAGSGSIGDTNYEAQLGANTIRGVGGGEPNYYYDAPVLPSDVVILSSATMNGGDGGWPVLYGPDPLSNEQLSLAIDEDQIVDLERGHTAEQVAYLILSESESNPNTAPSVVSPIEDLTVDEDSADSVIELYPVFEDAETADTDLVFTASSSDESLVTLAIDNSSGELTLSFVSDANGSATISVTATDDDAENPLSVVETFTVTVNPVNDAPYVVSPIADRTVEEDAPADTIDLQGIFQDAETSVSDLNFEVVENTNPSLVTTALSDGNLTLNYVADAHGIATIAVKATDDAATPLSVTETFSVTVTPVNDKPTAANAEFQMNQGTTLSGNLTGSDLEDDAITFVLVNAPSNGSAAVNSDGSFSYTPEPSFSGEDTFTYKVNDGNLDSAVATVTIDVLFVTEVSLSIMHPQDGMTVENVRPALMAPFTANFDIRESDFRVYLDGIDYSADVMIEGDKAAFLPFFDFSEGSHTYRIDIVIDDTVLASATTTFTVEAALPNPTDTQFSGQVQSLEGLPIEGVVVYSGVQTATTDVNGQFSFTDLPYGNNLFEFDPSGAADGKLYTPVNLSFEVRPGRKTVWERPVFLAEYDPANGVAVVSNAPEDQVIENPGLPGVKVVIPAGTEIDFPDGSDSGVVTIVDIPVALSPNCLGAGLRPSRLISLQPENTRLSQPAQLIFPNDLDLPEGTAFDLMSLNIETGIFGQVGLASVVNGEVVTNLGSGLRTFDWHTPAPRPPRFNPNVDFDVPTNDKKQSDSETVCSSMIMRTGELMEDHSIPAYHSLGASRSVGLHYSSLIAAPEFLVNTELIRSRFSAIPDSLSLTTSTPVGSVQSFFEPNDLLEDSSVSAARSLNASDLPSGEYELTARITGRLSWSGGEVLSSSSRSTTAEIFNGRDMYPALGIGWSISNVSHLLFDGDGDITILNGRGRKTLFEEGGIASLVNGEEVSIDNLGFELGLAGIGRSGIFGTQEDPRSIVSNLGFIRPTEGKQMLLLQNTDENGLGLNDELAISIPLQRKPFGANSLVFDLDLLADELIENGSEVIRVDLFYRDPSGSLFSTTTAKSPGVFSRVYGGIVGTSQFSTVLAGVDSGYASRSGFRTMGVNISQVPLGAPMCLRIQIENATTFVDDEYGSGPVLGIARAAALIDNLRYNYTPGSRGISFDRSYASEAGDYTTLGFDASSGIYARLFQDGSLQKFNSAGLEISITDRFGNETVYEYTDGDSDGEDDELARIIDPVGLVTELTYQNGKLYRITDPANRITEMTYDADGHLLQILNPDGTTRSFTYDDKGRLLSQTDGESNQRFYTYQPGSSRLASVTRADGQVYNYQPQQARGLPVAGTGSELAPAALYQSETLGKNTVSTDARGISTSKTLDENGQPIQVVDNLGNEINMRYDFNRNPTLVTTANGEAFNFTYDAFGNMTRTTRDYDNATTRIRYDTALFDLPIEVTDPLGRMYSFEYDLLGNLTRTTDPLNQTSEFTYNAAGQVLTATDKLGQASTYAYDSLGRLVSITDELGRTVTYGYDAAGNQTTVTDPQGRVTATVYDDAGDPIQVTSPDGGVTQFSYDGNKNLIRLVDSLGRTKSWTYDERERVISYTDALGRTTFMQYDEVGNMIAYTREDGTVIEYVYDDVNRVSEVRYPALTGVAADTVSYTYDELYRVTNQSDNDSSIDYVFDPISRLTSTTQTWNSQADTLSFGYDLVDRRISMTDTTGTTTYIYDDLDRMIDLTDSANRSFGFTYDPLNRVIRKTMANGTATDFTYDAASQLLDIITEKVGTSEVIESIAYTYNTTGTRSSETRFDGNTRTFFYDANDRVTQVINSQLPDENELFAYDLMGNWTIDSRQHNAENELTQDSGYTYSYDDLGNMTTKQSLSDPADLTTYTWDARNLLIAVNGPVSDTSYAYDARNRRVAKTVDGNTTQYVHDGLNVLLEYDGAGDLLARNTHAGLDQLCVRDEVTASTPYYICQDGISSVLSISDDNGNILQRYRYSAFGEQQVLDADFDLILDGPLIPFAYTAREWEPEVGMYFYRARFFDPALGRFISRDPLGLGGGDVNLYAYVLNDPINLNDPTGLWFGIDDAIFAGAGALIGVVAQGVADVATGELSGWEYYAGAAVGGAVAGETLLYTANPFLAGAAGGASSNITKQGLKTFVTGKQENFSLESLAVDTAIGTATGLIPGRPKIPRINAGQGSNLQVFRQISTKAQNGTINSISSKTAAKMATGAFYEYAVPIGAASSTVLSELIGDNCK